MRNLPTERRKGANDDGDHVAELALGVAVPAEAGRVLDETHATLANGTIGVS